MPELAPEAKAREQIDALPVAAGWILQYYTRFDASASRNIALREIPVTGGRCDYLLLIDRSTCQSSCSAPPARCLSTTSRPASKPSVAMRATLNRARAACLPFNLLNAPPFGAPNGVLGTASFGTITTAGDPRVVQLALKLQF